MKKYLSYLTLLFLYASVTPAFAYKHEETDAKNIALITAQYKDFLENKKPELMDKYIAKDVKFYRDFNKPENYDALYQHVISQNEKCVTLKILPFDKVVASGNTVVALYTLSCTDKNNVVEKKRIMSIAELNKDKKVSAFWQVSHADDSAK